MKDILIIAHFTHVPGEKGNSRFNYIANLLADNNFKVEVVTTSFSHRTKDFRVISKEQQKQLKYKLTLIEEKGYNNNVSIKRFYSHYIFGKNLKLYLKKRKKPDIIYCAVPSLDCAYYAAKFAKENNINFIIDIQDLWPEAFKMILNIPIINDIVFYPMTKKANYIYSTADKIVAVSNTYGNRALKVNNKCKEALCIYLGTDLDYFDNFINYSKQVIKSNNEFWVAYIGTLGHSYDICSVIDALKIVQNKGINNIKFIVMGDGPLKSKFEAYADKKGVNAEFFGRLEYSKMVSILSICDVAVNPIKSGSAASIINKVGDYAAAGLPVLNTQESSEYRALLNEYNAGFNCENNSPEDLAKKLLILYKDSEIRKIQGANSRKLAEEKFDRKRSYHKLINLLEEL